jgi:hypothetical protein
MPTIQLPLSPDLKALLCGNCGDCGGTVQSDCCPNPIPATLFATVSSDCQQINGTIRLTDPHGDGKGWVGSQGRFTYRLNCSDGWEFEITWLSTGPFPDCLSDGEPNGCGGVLDFVPDADSCEPFQVTFSSGLLAASHSTEAGCCFLDADGCRLDFIPLSVVVTE